MKGVEERVREWARKYEGYFDPEPLAEAVLSPLPVTARVNALRVSRPTLMGMLEERGYSAKAYPWYGRAILVDGEGIGKLPEHRLGLFYIQELSAMFPVVVLDPRPGERILDMAAAPGGKATQIAEHIANLGTVVAVEKSRRRVKALRANVDRMGAFSVTVIQADSRFLRARGVFDKVLLDPPCSSEASIRKDPRSISAVLRNNPETLSRLQASMLRAARRYLRRGGILVYSTCTLDPRENERIVSMAIGMGFRALPVRLPFRHHRGIREFGGEEYHEDVRLAARIHPDDGPFAGMFIARLLKI